MVYIATWAAYQSAAEALYERAPERTRYCVKWKPSESKLVLKITDDTTCLKYKTHSSIYLNRFEALNLALMQKMQNVRVRAAAAAVAATIAAGAAKASVGVGVGVGVGVDAGLGSGSGEASRAGTPVPAAVRSGGVQGGGVKKKKGKKKK